MCNVAGMEVWPWLLPTLNAPVVLLGFENTACLEGSTGSNGGHDTKILGASHWLLVLYVCLKLEKRVAVLSCC